MRGGEGVLVRGGGGVLGGVETTFCGAQTRGQSSIDDSTAVVGRPLDVVPYLKDLPP